MIEEVFNIFRETVRDPYKEVRRWKDEQGGKVIGFLITDVPEELIHAAGFFPYGVSGGNVPLEKVDAHLQSWACSMVRSSFAMALNGKLDFLDGFIIPQVCDTTRMVSGVWKHTAPLPFMENYLLPRQTDRPSAKKYLIGELQRLKNKLEEYRGAEISIEQIRQSIQLYNDNRKLLRTLFSYHKQYPLHLNNSDFYTIIKASMVMPREKLNNLLRELVHSLEAQTGQWNSPENPRLILSGSVWEPIELLHYIDEAGGTVVGDDLQNGYRYIETDAELAGDPLEALAARQLNRIPFACYDSSRAPRSHFLVNMALQERAQGVIFLHLKYCEPENFDYYDNLRALKQNNIPAIKIETEFGGGSLGQLQTRIQAFMEMIGSGA